MVDLANVSQVTALVSEKQIITQALDNLEQGGRIVAMSVAPPPPELPEGAPQPPPSMGISVSTQFIDYPPQMVAAIKTALNSRLQEVIKELSDMGVTGMDTQRKKGK